MTARELLELNDRAKAAGFQDVASYCISLRRALVQIANANSGVWGRIAHEALTGRRSGPGWATRAVAQRGHDQLDDQADAAIFVDGTRVTPGTEACKCEPSCELPCWQRLGWAPACEACGCPAFEDQAA